MRRLKHFKSKLLGFFALLLLTQISFAQTDIKGNISDTSGEPLVGASVVIKGTTTGTITDTDGDFVLKVDALPVTLVASYIGFQPQELEVSSADFLNIQLAEGLELDDILVVGSRFAPRTVITSPVPIDNVKADELISTGQQTFDKMLHYTIPSFNSTQQTISDATAHFDPADLRGLGPSRTLVLINGKRKNPSSLVYINDTPGKGEVGVDMKSIPAASIERIEVLRDGASATYGSDAVAGVINIILKDDTEYTNFNMFSGITTEGDGFLVGYDLNTGFKIGEDGGYVNVSTSFSDLEETNRAPSTGEDMLFGVSQADNPWLAANPNMGMIVGTPAMTTADIFYNAALPLGDEAELYTFGGLVSRQGRSYALYRTPYWVPDPHFLLHDEGTEYQGFHPTFETEIFDRTFAVGIRGKKGNWDYDISHISGGNTVNYIVNNSLNPDLGAQSPTTFRPGGYEFSNNVTNLDVSRKIGVAQLSLGTEFRTENFKANEGEEASWFGSGTQSFPGLQPQNAVDANRYNIGAYADIAVDVTEDFLLGGALRFEDYSDFGTNASWQANARYKFMDDRFSIRGSAGSSFRAPSLHQRYLSIIQTLVSGGTISNQGTFNNESTVIRSLKVPNLKDEEGINMTFGVAFKPADGLYISADYYRVAVDDRVVYSSSIASSDTTTAVGAILAANDITSLKFFANAVNTITTGVDFVANYNTDLGTGKLGINLAANFNETEINGQIATPAPIQEANFDIFDRKEQSRILTARPNSKILFGLSYDAGKFKGTLNNTRFGTVTWQHGTDPSKDQTFSAKIVTDLHLSYRFTDKVGLAVSANNLLNVYPDEIDTKGDVITDLGGRFQYPWEVNQFGFNGTTLAATLNFRF